MGAGEGSEDSQARLRLRCLAGGAAPDDLAAEAARANKLSAAAVDDLWRVVEPCLIGTVTPELDRELGSFCRHHELAEADLGHVIRIACFLLRNAAALNLDERPFEEDLRAVFPTADRLQAMLRARYAPAKARIRAHLLRDAMEKHGNVLTDIDWRVDRVVAGSGAPHIDLPVGLVTFSYAHRGQNEHLTLHMTPDHLESAAKVLTALAQETRRLAQQAAVSPVESAGLPPRDEGT